MRPTAVDAYPRGCVDCHVAAKGANPDTRLSTLIAKWTTDVGPALLQKTKASASDPAKIKGKHLAVPNVSANIPQSCLGACHKKDSTIAPSFARLIHVIHLTGERNTFLTTYQGDCTHCHKLDKATGIWKIPSGPER